MGRRRSQRCLLGESLESRVVCNASWAGALAKEIHELAVIVKFTMKGKNTSTTPLDATSRQVDYSGTGKANLLGSGLATGSEVITSAPGKKHQTNDSYSQGALNFAGTTDTVQATYTGAGHTQSNGSFTATLRGHATSIAGLHQGLGGDFVATISGNNRTGKFTISLKMTV